ncbi:ACT domain-containing protein [Aerococcus sanguinicola]|uniref:ACT domain-containing protein n=1 Tax=Aerococcus sanguinicola TaxID=119206 RepID=A0A109RDH4_9LACT|nr:hypothetical protein [Aerococcus sanguinicola]AMB93639.1 hypothetical protein AWM72_02160 [Aerococcus sanguinicola]
MGARIIQTRVVNRPGVLNRITQTVLKPGYNIDTLTLQYAGGSADSSAEFSIITLGIQFADQAAAELLMNQLEKQIDVIYAVDITDGLPSDKEREDQSIY